MPIELQLIRAKEFVRLGANHRLDLASSKLALEKLVRACRKRDINQALLDLRNYPFAPTPVFTLAQLADLVSTFRELGLRHEHRLAILYSADPHRRARLFAFLGTLHGWNVAAFETFEEALVWLAGDELIDIETSRQESKIPINFPATPAGGNNFHPKRERY